MSSLGVVALVSGGKDSLFSILHCIQNGHRVLALGNLHPSQESVQDMDSFMYQTVGHNVIELIAQALELPLYRQAITGSAVSTSRTYDGAPQGDTHADEVESMLALLGRVKEAHPEVNAVCTGAIMSDYQRTRVESIAIRLGLTPLSYLWQFPFLPPYSEASLLHDMDAAGQDSRIIKVASGALDETFLWKNVADRATIHRLSRAAERFGAVGDGSMIGEGGEYETLAIDGPAPLWKHKIVVKDDDRVSIDGDAGTAIVEVKRATVAPKDGMAQQSSAVRQPPMLDDIFQTLQARLLQEAGPFSSTAEAYEPKLVTTVPVSSSVSESAELKHFDNITADGSTATEQTRGIMTQLFHDMGVLAQDVLHTVILLRDMAEFQTVNSVYGSFFQKPNPPSRVTVSCGSALPEGVLVCISFTCAKDHIAQQRSGLHVQSRSYWAPANIGPYSQAIAIRSPHSTETAGSLTHIAGQIPLIPASMDLVNDVHLSPHETALQNCILSLQHLWRIGTIMNVQLWLGGLACIGRTANGVNPKIFAQAASKAWSGIHADTIENGEPEDEEDDDFDVWDRKYGNAKDMPSQTTSTYRQTIQRSFVPPFFTAEVETLPRNASVEWVSTGWNSVDSIFVVERDTVSPEHQRIFSTSSADKTLLSGWIAIANLAEAERAIGRAGIPNRAHSTLYTTLPIPPELSGDVVPQIIPCYNLWDKDGNELEAVLAYTVLGGQSSTNSHA